MTDELMLRLQNCYNFLEDEGHYTKANTVHLAIDRIKALDGKLAKAVEALGEAWFMLTVPHLDYEPEPEEPGLRRIKTTLAELEGERQVAIDAAKRIEELEAALEWLIAGAETVLEEWDRGDEAAFREAIEEMRADVEEAKGEKM